MFGFWGFVVTFTDNTRYSEKNGSWLDMPAKPITKVELCTPGLRAIILEGYNKYFFNNEAIFRLKKIRGKGEVVAKMLGATKNNKIVEYRSEKTKKGYELFKRDLLEFPYAKNILKKGEYHFGKKF